MMACLRLDDFYVVSSMLTQCLSFKIVGWAIRPCDPDKNDGYTVRFDVHFESAETTVDWDKIAKIPTAEQSDDYLMYKTIHREQREYKRREAHDIFETSFPPGLSDAESSHGIQSRSMSISEIAGLGSTEFLRTQSSSNSDSDQWEESKTAVDGSSDKAYFRVRRPAFMPDLITPLSRGISRTTSMRNLLRAPLGFAAVEPFASLRKTLTPQRTSYDGSDDAGPPGRIIDTRFRPVNWNPAPKHNLRPAFDVSDEDLLTIAPFSDLRRRLSSADTIAVSPKTSIADFRARHRQRGRDRKSSQATIFEYPLPEGDATM